jgi:pyruvate/2-oxoglutarate dehydrogenase complex dihydrolipoamide dehydrogenase (E3) component
MSIQVAIIGAYGSGGSAVTGALVDEPDVDLLLFDDGDPGGGLCILDGCMPSKEVLSAGAHRYQARHDDRLVGEVPDVDLERVVQRKDDHTLGWAAHRRESIHEYAERDDVRFLREPARFVDERTVAAGGERYEPDYVVVATGSRVNVPELRGMEEVEVMTSADVLDATSFPDTGIVMGFGYVGMELVPYLVEAGGMELTAVEHDDRPLGQVPPAFGEAALELYREEFDVTIPTNVYEKRVEQTDGGVRLVLDGPGGEQVVEADQLFCFTGREPAVDRVSVGEAGIEQSGEWVADTMQARDNDRVFVVGDANGKEPVLHVAKEQGHQAAENILAHARGESLEPYENVTHRVMFTGLGVYPFARVGHTPASAREAGHEVVVATREATDDGVFKAKDVPRGLAKLVVDRTDGTVLGYQGLHFHADAMAKTMQVIVELGLDVREVPDRAYHPTTPEIIDGLLGDAAGAVGE